VTPPSGEKTTVVDSHTRLTATPVNDGRSVTRTTTTCSAVTPRPTTVYMVSVIITTAATRTECGKDRGASPSSRPSSGSIVTYRCVPISSARARLESGRVWSGYCMLAYPCGMHCILRRSAQREYRQAIDWLITSSVQICASWSIKNVTLVNC